jgi:predicted nucleic acid-binding protein
VSDRTEPATADGPRPLFLLDTDILSLVLRGEPRVARHVTSTPGSFIATSIITAEEMLQGRLAQVGRAREAPQMASAYL